MVQCSLCSLRCVDFQVRSSHCWQGVIVDTLKKPSHHWVKIVMQGDLIPWTIGQQFQDPDFPSLSGARIVRIAVHPGLNRAG